MALYFQEKMSSSTKFNLHCFIYTPVTTELNPLSCSTGIYSIRLVTLGIKPILVEDSAQKLTTWESCAQAALHCKAI